MSKNRKDAVGGHAKRDLEIAGICGWSVGFKRFAKDRANRMLRRQQRHIKAEALLEYEADYQDWLDWQAVEDDEIDYNECFYNEYLDDFEREESDRERDDWYDREMRYEAEREFETFIYDRDIDNADYRMYDYDPY